jgi:MFS family permease
MNELENLEISESETGELTAVSPIPAPHAAEDVPHLQRNFFLGVFNGAMFNFAETLMSVDTVLTWFVQQLGGSYFLIGLVGPMRDAGWFLPQLFVSKWLEKQSHKLPQYRSMAVIRCLAWLTWALSTLFIRDFNLLLLLFFIAYGVNAIASGLSGLSFMDIVAKTIPPRRRGSYFGSRLFFGAILAIGGSAIVSLTLERSNPINFPRDIGWLFLLSWVAASLGLFAFGYVIEPPGDVRLEETTMRSHVRRAARLTRHNEDFRYFLIARVLLMLSYVATPFYAIYSIEVLHAPAEIIGVYIAARTLASVVINPIWGRLSDRRSNRLVVRAATVIGMIVPAWAIFSPLIASALHIDPTYIFVPIFVLLGLFDTGVGIGETNLMFELAPDDDRSIYIGLTNTVMGIAYFSTIISGLLVTWLGYNGVFSLALIFFGVSLWAISRVSEPREMEVEPINES